MTQAPGTLHCRRSNLLRTLVALLGLLLLIGQSQLPNVISHAAAAESGQFQASLQHADAAHEHCDKSMPAAGGGHSGCSCLHGCCGGFFALFDHRYPLGAISSPIFIDLLYQAAPLPAHNHPPFRPPTRLNV